MLIPRGVRIHIIIFKEYKERMPNDSEHTKKKLESLNSNIKVLRHPVPKFSLWSHHEKSVVIDQCVGFLGGVDLCYGRYDTEKYHLNEPNQKSRQSLIVVTFFPGADFNNVRIKDFVAGRNFLKPLVDKDCTPRMPWRDIHLKIEGSIVIDMSRNFIQYWSFVMNEYTKEKKPQVIGMTTLKRKESSKVKKEKLEKMENNKKKIMSDFGPKPKNRTTWTREDCKPVLNVTDTSSIDKRETIKPDSKTIRKPSNTLLPQDSLDDVWDNKNDNLLGIPSPASKNSQRQRLVKSVVSGPENSKARLEVLINELKESSKLSGDANIQIIEKESEKLEKKQRVPDDTPKDSTFFNFKEKLKALKGEDLFTNPVAFNFNSNFNSRGSGSLQPRPGMTHCAQLVRSAGEWSLGLKGSKCESSIYFAYLELINEAKNFIYIENQFFISSTAGDPIKNMIAEILVSRIKRAIETGENFLVVIVIPLMPGFEGGVEDKNGFITRLTLMYQQLTISQGPTSIMSQLKEVTDHPDRYIKFFGLRQHSLSHSGEPITEQVYIHSKMMIVDDDRAIIGSANINDRSLLGFRDAELGVVLEDEVKRTALLGGSLQRVSGLIHDLRIECFSQIFGLTKEAVEDPLEGKLWREVESRTQVNTQIYRSVFGCPPDNQMRSLREQKNIKQKSEAYLYGEAKESIKGLAVEYPLDYVCDEDLKKVGLNDFGMYFVPDVLFT